MRHFPKAFVKYDEIYQPKEWSRDKVNVLLSLDPTKLNYANNPRVHRTDHDFAVAWDKMYGKGRVFYSTLGHTEEAWNDPDISKMYFEAIKWVLGMTEGSTASHPRLHRRSALMSIELRRNISRDEFSSFGLALECMVGGSIALEPRHAQRKHHLPAVKLRQQSNRARQLCANRTRQALVRSGRDLFRQDCSFCHGRDAGGGESGPDLTRSKLVTEDVDGDKIGEVVRNGRPDKGMPRFDRSDQQIASLAAFIHTQQNRALARGSWRT